MDPNDKYQLEIKKAVLPRPATTRELQLLANVMKGRNRGATQDQRRLSTWSQHKLEESLHPKAA